MMKEFRITTLVRECSIDELSKEDRELVEAAKDATRTSYAVYSKFHVGAVTDINITERCMSIVAGAT